MNILLSLLSIAGGLTLNAGNTTVTFEKTERGYAVASASSDGLSLAAPSGECVVLFSAEKPSGEPIMPKPYPEYPVNAINDRTYSAVGLNTAGEALRFLPEELAYSGDDILVFRHDCPEFTLVNSWYVRGGDIILEQRLSAKKDGWWSLQTPTLAEFDRNGFTWATIPGYYHSDRFNPDFHTALNYGIGIPEHPAVLFEGTCTTLTALITDDQGLSLAVSALPGQSRDPWKWDSNTNGEWKVGVSLVNRDGIFTPSVHKPILGEEGSWLKAGESTTLKVAYTLKRADWYSAYSHVAHDINRLPEQLAMRETHYSLSRRLSMLRSHVLDNKASRWRTVELDGRTLGAQDYLGSVKDSDHDAMKNADYGTMWMLGRLTGDPRITSDRLPYALNFKFANQGADGATKGQYYLYKSQRFTEEWGHYTEPMANTFYMLCDLGNISLFEPENQEIRDRIRLAADRLLEWMHPDGHWEVAYDNVTGEPQFTDIPDLRPTFYGLVIAYRTLGDRKYLDAAIKGGDWLLENAVRHGSYIGVCGDTRFAPDFATAQTAQAFNDLYGLTGDRKYLQAYIDAAEVYTTHVFTHPFPTDDMKLAGEKIREYRRDFEISQVGMNFEHGGTFGSANKVGPILLASHAGMFVRQAALTGDSLMLDMARLAVMGRDAFISKTTGAASYYWYAMNRGPGPFPHHAWWQIGWMTDYLIAEAFFRSGGEIDFPGGFFTPKVGPHRPYGFAPGRLYGRKVRLTMEDGLDVDNQYVEYITARSLDDRRLFIVLMNNSTMVQEYSLDCDGLSSATSKSAKKDAIRRRGTIEPWGMEVVTIKI